MLKTQKAGTQCNLAEMGQVAGQLWHCLCDNGKIGLTELERKMEAAPTLTHMAIGWLAREGKVDLAQEGRSIKVWLTESI